MQLTGLGGVIESPNFPNNYPPSRNCTWQLIAPVGNKYVRVDLDIVEQP